MAADLMKWNMIQTRETTYVMDNAQPQLEQTHLALKQAIAQYMAILSAALDPILTIDLTGTIHTASDSIHRVFGWKPEELIGQNINLLMPSPHRESHDGYLANYRRTGQTNILGRTRQFHGVRKDGNQFPLELSVSRVNVPGRDEPLFMGIIHDISDRHRLELELEQHRQNLEELVQSRTRQLEATHEQLRQADRLASIGTLAAGLGHDMNNVLLPIRARLDAMDSADIPAKAREQFIAIRRSIAYLQQLSDGLHLLALDPDDADASSGVTNLTEWWNQIGSLLRKAVPKRVELVVDIPPNLPLMAVAPHRLTQAVLNLVVNAGEAITGEGQVRLWAGVKSIAGNAPHSRAVHEYVQLGVTDTGEGMSADVKKHALDPFFTTKKRGLGTGLGLSLVHGVARAAGGSVDIDSEIGRGTTFTLNIPVGMQPTTSDDAARTAAVTIHDRRAASFVRAVLQSAGLNVHNHGNQKSEPCCGSTDGCRVWIVQPTATTPQEIRRFIKADPRRRVILFGSAGEHDEAFMLPGVIIIEDPTDFEMIRSTIGRAILARDHVVDQPTIPDHGGTSS